MKILMACEYSGIVRDAFIAKGHDAISCDLLPTERPGPHYQGNVFDIINTGFDMMIAHPPCTYLCRQANRWINDDSKRQYLSDAMDFFNRIKNANIDKIAIENPIPHARAKQSMGEYTQIIQPYQFGHDYSKKTCLWLKGLPKLEPTNVVSLTYYTTPNGRKYTAGWYKTPRNSIERSRTFTGIADAMANTWGNL